MVFTLTATDTYLNPEMTLILYPYPFSTPDPDPNPNPNPSSNPHPYPNSNPDPKPNPVGIVNLFFFLKSDFRMVKLHWGLKNLWNTEKSSN